MAHEIFCSEWPFIHACIVYHSPNCKFGLVWTHRLYKVVSIWPLYYANPIVIDLRTKRWLGFVFFLYSPLKSWEGYTRSTCPIGGLQTLVIKLWYWKYSISSFSFTWWPGREKLKGHVIVLLNKLLSHFNKSKNAYSLLRVDEVFTKVVLKKKKKSGILEILEKLHFKKRWDSRNFAF